MDNYAKSKGSKSKAARSSGGGAKFQLADNMQSWDVKMLPTNSEQYDLKRIKPYNCGSKGYPAEAMNYKY